MEIKEFFPIKIGQEDLSDVISIKQIKDWVELSKNIEHEKKYSREFTSLNEDILDLEEFKNLKNIILDRSKKFCDEIKYTVEDVQISNSWLYLLQSEHRANNWHHHANSSISGVFYLTDASDIAFMDPHHKLNCLKSYDEDTFFSNFVTYIKPKKNTLILFPSFLEHAVMKSNDLLRVSLAFNIIPKGRFGPRTAKITF